jgi:hypothetical protein
MIYALLTRETPLETRKEIATAVQNRDVEMIDEHVKKGTIIHILNYLERIDRSSVYCIWCRDVIHMSNMNQPKDRQRNPDRYWFFKHKKIGDCKNLVRFPPKSDAIAILNPGDQGCYVLLACEDADERDRKSCQTILGDCTYCHLAKTHDCI